MCVYAKETRLEKQAIKKFKYIKTIFILFFWSTVFSRFFSDKGSMLAFSQQTPQHDFGSQKDQHSNPSSTTSERPDCGRH